MSKSRLLFIILFIQYPGIKAQVGNTWMKLISESAASQDHDSRMCALSDGGFAIVSNGQFLNTIIAYDQSCIRKTDSVGNVLWARRTSTTNTAGNPTGSMVINIIQAQNGNLISVGLTGDSSFGSGDVFVMNMDSSGNMIWKKHFGGTSQDIAYDVVQTADGGFAITGFTSSFGAGNDDVYVIKIDSSGTLQWSKVIGGADVDRGSSIIQAPDRGYVIGGYTKSFGKGNYDMYVIKLDSAGSLKWTRTIGGANAEYARRVILTKQGRIVIAGSTTSFGVGVYLVCLDSTGKLISAKPIGLGAAAMDIKQTADDGFIIVGSGQPAGMHWNDIYLIKTDSLFNNQWARRFGGGGDDEAFSVQLARDGGYVVNGFSFSFSTNQRILLMKTDSLGYSCNFTSVNVGIDLTGGDTSSGGILTNVISQAGTAYSILPMNALVTSLCVNPTGLNNETALKEYSIYPNPSPGHFIIKSSENWFHGYEILNVLGVRIRTMDFESPLNTCEINISKLAPGLYYLKILDENGVKMAKLIKE